MGQIQGIAMATMLNGTVELNEELVGFKGFEAE